MKDQSKVFPILLAVASVVGFIAMCLEFFAPSPIKEISGGYVLIFIASMIVFRAVQVFTNDERARSTLPYSVATFLVLIPTAFLAPPDVARIAWWIFFAIVGVAGFYWTVKIIIDSFKEEFLKKK